jgi:hypothetical protein
VEFWPFAASSWCRVGLEAITDSYKLQCGFAGKMITARANVPYT